MSAAIEFNAQMYVSEQLTRQLVNTAQDVSMRCVQVLAEKYNFDAEEEIRMLGLNMIKLERKVAEKAKVEKTVKVQAPKSAFPLPYNGEFNEAYCYALRQNNGLYTQCTGIRKGENTFCKGCASQMQKVGAEMPEYGTIQQRMAVGIFEYVDPKGRKPIAYAKIMKKYKITQEEVLEEAGKFNIVINPEHFVVVEAEGKRGRPKAEKVEKKEKGAKGRPKKTKKVIQIEGDDDDLFASLVAEANEVEDEEIVLPAKKKVKSDEEKEAERLAKAEKEKKRLAEKAEREAKLAAEKEEKAAKKKAEEEARALKKQQEEEARAAKKLEAEKAKAEKKTSKKAPVVDPVVEEEEKVKKIMFEGNKYLKSLKSGIVYDYNKYVKEQEQVVIGKWSETTNKIIFDDAEESEEEYD
jgi:hypothetical protein